MAIFFFIRDFSQRVAKNDFPESRPLPTADSVGTVSFSEVPDKCLLKQWPRQKNNLVFTAQKRRLHLKCDNPALIIAGNHTALDPQTPGDLGAQNRNEFAGALPTWRCW
jgi:hypothetical protein